MQNIAINEPVPFEYHAPARIEDALALASRYHGNFAYLAGGCDLLDMMKRQWNRSAHVIDLKPIDGLRGIATNSDRVTVGALTKLIEVQQSDLSDSLRAFKEAASRVATPQIRNMGTVGGNVLQDSRCPYYRGPFDCYRHGGITCDAHHGINREHAIFGGDRCYTVTPSDLAPAVVALGGIIHVHDTDGERTMPADHLFISPSQDITTLHSLQNGPILTRIEFSVRPDQRSRFIKEAVRNAWDFARASVAVSLELRGGRAHNVRIVLGGVAAVPWRNEPAERVVEGSRVDTATIEKAVTVAVEGAAPLKYNEYKVGLTRKLVRQALTEIMA
jgi:xanthine dehydrogenase YagS FAD-binding subunit